jgi:DcuC family C4-dicarboxylate transporter
MTVILGAVVITLAIIAIARRVEVRLALFLAALALGALVGNLPVIIQKFFATFADEKFVVPICCAMGFAYVLKFSGCDQHLVHLLVRPLQRVRALLIPGTVLVGFLVNIPIISQTSTAVTIGPVLIPLLLAARLSPVTIGAALLMGSSIGGELLNPGAPELRTVLSETAKGARERGLSGEELTGARLVEHLMPLNLLSLTVATLLFWYVSARAEKRARREKDSPEGSARVLGEPAFRVNLFKALVPVLPLVLLFLTTPAFEVLQVPREWLLEPPAQTTDTRFDSRLIGTAMLVGVGVATLVAPGKRLGVAGAFFEGAGYAFTHIISLIVIASCFGEGIRVIGLAALLGDLIEAVPALLFPLAGALSLGFGVLCGSGMATTQSLFGFFVSPALDGGISQAADVGAVVSLSAAAGRCTSPVSAVGLMCANMTATNVVELVKRLALPLCASVAAVVLAAMLLPR